MFNKINKIFDFNQKMLNIYNQRQEILASNIANADTPGYQAVDINCNSAFKKILYQENIKNSQFILKQTSPQHFSGKIKHFTSFKNTPVIQGKKKPDGNTVDMDRERIEFIENSLKYQSNIIFIKHEIKNIIHVLQG